MSLGQSRDNGRVDKWRRRSNGINAVCTGKAKVYGKNVFLKFNIANQNLHVTWSNDKKEEVEKEKEKQWMRRTVDL